MGIQNWHSLGTFDKPTDSPKRMQLPQLHFTFVLPFFLSIQLLWRIVFMHALYLDCCMLSHVRDSVRCMCILACTEVPASTVCWKLAKGHLSSQIW